MSPSLLRRVALVRRAVPGADQRRAWTAALALTVLAGLTGACTAPGPYLSGPGPHRILQREGLVITDPAQPRDIPIRVRVPAGPGPFPVVVFSHGARCYPQAYAAITDHWVTHGYVVILPDHLDSPNNAAAPTPDQLGRLLDSRIQDAAFALDQAEMILARAGFPGRGDVRRRAVAGHSFGGMIALVAAGLELQGPGGAPVRRPRQPVSAAVIMSGVGPMPELGVGPAAFEALRLPLMATGGTLDVGNTGGPEIRPWEWRMAPYTLAPAGDKYSVVLEEGDHYLGGLICRADRGGRPDPEGARIDGELTLAFLDAYLKDDPAARAFLREADIPRLTGGRARFQRK